MPSFSIRKVSGENPLVFDLSYRKKARCPHCSGKNLRKKTSFMRQVRHESIGHRQTLLRFQSHKFYCRDCEHYFNQRFPGIERHQRATARLQKQIFHQHTEGMSQKSLARDFKLGKATIERWYHRYYDLKNRELSKRNCPQLLGIDEHFFSRKQGFATTFCNLRKHKIFDVVKGRSSSDLASYFDQLAGKEQVKVVCMDLSSSYRHIVQKHFPNALIVADRFHVIRLMLHQCMQTYQEIDPKIKHQRGLLAALRTNPENLTEKRLERRDEYLKQQPAIAAIYQFKRQLHHLLMKKTVPARRCKRLIPLLLKDIAALRESGFRNFENYRLRVRVLCG